MAETEEQPNEWRMFVPSDPTTHPEHDSNVEWEFNDGTRMSGVYGAGWVWPVDRLPDNPSKGAQRWRYRPRE